MRFLLAILACFYFGITAHSIELAEIMSGNQFIGHQPYNIQWSPDSKSVYFRWNKENGVMAPYYQLDIESRKIQKLNSNEIKSLPVNGFITNRLKTHFYYLKEYSLFAKTKEGNKLLFTNYSPFSLHQILDNGDLIIQQGINFYLLSPANFSFTQLTNFVSGTKPQGYLSTTFLETQQKELFEIVRQEEIRKNDRESFNDSTRLKKIQTIYLDKKLGNVAFNESLDKIVFGIDNYPTNTNTHIEEYVNSTGYSESQVARPKVGSEDATHQLYYFDYKRDSLFEIKIDNLSGVYNRPLYLREYEKNNFEEKSEKPKNVIFHNHGFNVRGDLCLIEIKSYDCKDRWICIYNTINHTVNQLSHQHDECWIGGPGISSWKFEKGNCGWISDNELFYQSEETGYSHLYTSLLTTDGKIQTTNQITNGKFEIHEAIYDWNKKIFYISANKNHPGNREFYTLSVSDKKLIPITVNDGFHNVYVSPDGKNLIDLYSYKNKPWEIYLGSLKEKTALQQMTYSTTDNFNKYSWRKPEVINFKAMDSTLIYARLYEPLTDKKNNAAIIFVHGAGYLQNAHNYWSSYYREYMFHNLLADEGYTILDIDYRASEGYGRDFRTGIYRFMGGKDLSDQLDGRKFLIDSLNIDSTRIGIYGGSYGGFITLMALLTQPGKFKCGAALRSVTDWAHYNHEYTSNILNTPETDPIAYKRSSPIYFAEGLQDELLILHGIEDDNVHYQDVVRLTQRFIELKKTHWNIVGYPIEPHGFVETTSWYDEYRRIHELFNQNLLQ